MILVEVLSVDTMQSRANVSAMILCKARSDLPIQVAEIPIEVIMTAIKTNFTVLVICILCLLITVNLVNCFSKDSACGNTHGCWGDCDGGCTFILMWTPAGSGVHFSIKVSFPSNANQWAAFAISTSKSMQDSSVTSCIVNSTGIPFAPENSYNAASGNTNTVVSNVSH
ncbi:unnamed protein product [Mytilus coruscus]|uniref:DOMON domain-containing protein n=1 Tax=Mytilus coruscus TaxID=42192 RepID=A0A6J8AJR2_MYTCO|nr:unnamed protein product [Mytilus coruscus]